MSLLCPASTATLPLRLFMIVLFSKGCPNPTCPICAAAAVAPVQATAAHARRQPPCQGAANPTAGATAPTNDRVGRGQQPLAGALQPALFAGATLQAGVPTGGCRPLWATATASDAGLPCGLALVAAGRPLAGDFSRGLTVGRSYIPVFQIRMEKMKEVKRPPL
ncbi:hypothetical protein BHM03_00056437 [Ensete ventricosum]|nr:hypothetical protein BHM03_00056437 [Ensete ventricosum]